MTRNLKMWAAPLGGETFEPAGTLRLTSSADRSVASPARQLQRDVGLSLVEDEAIQGKWSGRKSAAFMIGSSLVLWGLIIAGVQAAL